MARTPRDRALGLALRKARKDCGLTLRELGERIQRHSGEISRWETGERPLTPDRVAQILTALGINGERYEEIVSLAYDKRPSSWVGTSLPERAQQLSALIDFEDAASAITNVTPLLVPGLLQVPRYIRAIMTAGGVPETEVATRVAVRVGRRDVITRNQPAQFTALIGEAVLHQLIGNKAIMVEQLTHLLDMAKRPNIELRVIPYSAGWNPALEGTFTLIESTESTPIVQLENRRSTLFLHEDEDIRAYRHAVEHLHRVAVGVDDTVRLISGTIRRLETRNE